MKATIPQWLIELSKELATQDGRATADPAFAVREQVTLPCHDYFDPDGWQAVSVDYCSKSPFFEDPSDAVAWVNESESVDLTADDMRLGDLAAKGTYRLWPVFRSMRIVNTFLTDKAARQYIEENRHHLDAPDVFVISLNRCHEMIRLRKWILSLQSSLD